MSVSQKTAEIDLDSLNLYLDSGGFFSGGERVTVEVLLCAAKYSKQRVSSLFPKYNGKTTYLELDIICPKCRAKITGRIGRAKFFHYVDNTRLNIKSSWQDDVERSFYRLCCKNCQEESDKAEKEKSSKEETRKKEYLFDQLLNEWLVPFDKYPEDFPKINSDLFRGLNRSYFINADRLAKHIKSMPYYDYLKTPLWRVIAWQVKAYAHFKCKMCSSNKDLVTHHSNYEFLGYEILKMDQLICICHACHERHHIGSKGVDQ